MTRSILTMACLAAFCLPVSATAQTFLSADGSASGTTMSSDSFGADADLGSVTGAIDDLSDALGDEELAAEILAAMEAAMDNYETDIAVVNIETDPADDVTFELVADDGSLLTPDDIGVDQTTGDLSAEATGLVVLAELEECNDNSDWSSPDLLCIRR